MPKGVEEGLAFDLFSGATVEDPAIEEARKEAEAEEAWADEVVRRALMHMGEYQQHIHYDTPEIREELYSMFKDDILKLVRHTMSPSMINEADAYIRRFGEYRVRFRMPKRRPPQLISWEDMPESVVSPTTIEINTYEVIYYYNRFGLQALITRS